MIALVPPVGCTPSGSRRCHRPVTAPDCILCGAGEVVAFGVFDHKRYWRCTRCELTFLDAPHRPDPAAERAHYRTHNNHPADPGYRAFLARLTVHLVPRLAPGARGLDFGCGPGPTVSVLMQEQGFDVVNYDPVFLPADIALERQYDFVTCTEVVEHFHDPRREFARLDTLLRPRAWLGVMTGMLTQDENFESWHYRRDPTHVAFYKASTFVLLARRFGWRADFPAPDIALFEKGV